MYTIKFVGRIKGRKRVILDMTTMRNENNFIERFISATNLYPDNIAYEIEGYGIKYTFSQCQREIEIWKGYFETLNVKQGDKVFVLLSNEAEFIFSFYALTSIGAVSAFYDVKATDYELNKVLEDFDPDGIVTSQKYIETREFIIDNKSLKYVLFKDSTDGINTGFWKTQKIEVSSLSKIPQKLTPPADDAIISCHFTYKGLGYPLQVRHKYNDYSMFLEQALKMYPQEPGSTHLVCLPYYPIYGISFCD